MDLNALEKEATIKVACLRHVTKERLMDAQHVAVERVESRAMESQTMAHAAVLVRELLGIDLLVVVRVLRRCRAARSMSV